MPATRPNHQSRTDLALRPQVEPRAASLWRRPIVLVVEDSEVIRRVLALVLEADGYQVVECRSGREVPDMVRSERPDVVTLDLSLPDADGRELLRQFSVEAGLRQVPVVVVSAYADVLTLAERRLAADIIVKPFDLDDLLARVRRAVERASGAPPERA